MSTKQQKPLPKSKSTGHHTTVMMMSPSDQNKLFELARRATEALERMDRRQRNYERATVESLKAILKAWPKGEQATVKKMLEGFVNTIK